MVCKPRSKQLGQTDTGAHEKPSQLLLPMRHRNMATVTGDFLSAAMNTLRVGRVALNHKSQPHKPTYMLHCSTTNFT